MEVIFIHTSFMKYIELMKNIKIINSKNLFENNDFGNEEH